MRDRESDKERNITRREIYIRSKRGKEREMLSKDSVKKNNLTFCEKISNIALNIKVT